MDKILSDGTVYTKARFLRTTCKKCGKELTKQLINSGYSWCDKKCKTLWVRKCNKKNGLNKKQRENLRHNQMMQFGSDFSNEDKFQGDQTH